MQRADTSVTRKLIARAAIGASKMAHFHIFMSMPEEERQVSHDPEDDGPMWDEGVNDMGEADFADFLSEDDGEDE